MYKNDLLVLSSYALWAGDDGYALELLGSIPSTGIPMDQEADSDTNAPADVFEATALALRQRLTAINATKRRDLKLLPASELALELNAPEQPHARILIAENGLLRSTIWSESPRDFSLKAYPTNLSRLKGLAEKAKAIADDKGWVLESDEDGKTTWVWNANGAFITISLDSWGLINVKFKWVATTNIVNSSEVEHYFRKVIELFSATMLATES